MLQDGEASGPEVHHITWCKALLLHHVLNEPLGCPGCATACSPVLLQLFHTLLQFRVLLQAAQRLQFQQLILSHAGAPGPAFLFTLPEHFTLWQWQQTSWRWMTGGYWVVHLLLLLSLCPPPLIAMPGIIIGIAPTMPGPASIIAPPLS